MNFQTEPDLQRHFGMLLDDELHSLKYESAPTRTSHDICGNFFFCIETIYGKPFSKKDTVEMFLVKPGYIFARLYEFF